LPSEEDRAATGLSKDELESFHWRKGHGCSQCRGTGFRGRKAVGELLVLNDELREAIIARVPVRQLKEMAIAYKVRFIRSAALELVRSGLTTVEEVNRVISA
jgi:general secretion pathway protein E